MWGWGCKCAHVPVYVHLGVWVGIHARMSGCACRYVCMYVRGRRQSCMAFFRHWLWIFKTVSHKPEAHQVGWLVGQKGPGICLSLSLQHWEYKHCVWIFLWGFWELNSWPHAFKANTLLLSNLTSPNNCSWLSNTSKSRTKIELHVLYAYYVPGTT